MMPSLSVFVIRNLVVLRRKCQRVELRSRVKRIGSRSNRHGRLGGSAAGHSSTEGGLFTMTHVQEDQSRYEAENQEDESDQESHSPIG